MQSERVYYVFKVSFSNGVSQTRSLLIIFQVFSPVLYALYDFAPCKNQAINSAICYAGGIMECVAT